MFFNNLFSGCLFVAVLIFSSASRAETTPAEMCGKLAGITVYWDKALSVYDASNPKTYTEFGGNIKCEIKPKGMMTMLNKYTIKSDWVATGNVWYRKRLFFYTTVTNSAGSTKKTYGDNEKELCSRLASESINNNYYASSDVYKLVYVRGDKSYNQLRTYNGHDHKVQSVSSADYFAEENKLKCSFEYIGVGSRNEDQISIKKISMFNVFEVFDDTEFEPCPAGTVRNGVECVLPEREEKAECQKGIVEELKGTTITLENLDLSGCHFELVSREYMSVEMPSQCLNAKYISSGLEARASDYSPLKSDSEGCDFTPPECGENHVYSYDTGLCYNAAGEYQTFDPEVEEPPVDVAGEGEVVDEMPVRDEEAGSGTQLEEGQEVVCTDGVLTGEVICSIHDADGSYVKPAPLDKYPEGTPISDDLCLNGYTGFTCSHNPSSGGTIPSQGDSIASVNNKLDALLGSSGRIEIDYDSVGEYGEGDGEGDGDGEGEGEGGYSFEDEIEKNKGELSEIGTCPEPTVIVFFEGVVFFDNNLEKEFLFEYTIICDFGNTYKDIYITIFVLMLGVGFIRRLGN
ncbi:hypothetical protein [Vibrio parahaemolyticus]|uniref:Uncharacterized protein n=1 Tax=Vibrio parahaemolyticus TaxID=670 RepID=A0AA46UKT1_VIBPH|nr:hypothetical protein [Vibrio parahaemolyticus]UYV26836.1 hypothetical protein M5598_02225 [Vibrio parahaemolyticus]